MKFEYISLFHYLKPVIASAITFKWSQFVGGRFHGIFSLMKFVIVQSINEIMKSSFLTRVNVNWIIFSIHVHYLFWYDNTYDRVIRIIRWYDTTEIVSCVHLAVSNRPTLRKRDRIPFNDVFWFRISYRVGRRTLSVQVIEVKSVKGNKTTDNIRLDSQSSYEADWLPLMFFRSTNARLNYTVCFYYLLHQIFTDSRAIGISC